MAGAREHTWRSVYFSDPAHPLSLTSHRVEHSQSFCNEIGIAEHYFNLTNIVDGTAAIDVVPGIVEGLSELEFSVENLDGSQRQQWTHVVHDYHLRTSRQHGNTLMLRTADGKAKLNLAEKNRAHRIDSFDGAARKVVEEHGFAPDIWEPKSALPEHDTLRQVNLTDYQWLLCHLMPRMDKGYYLYTNDGRKMNFHSVAHSAEIYRPDTDLILDVDEYNRVFAALKMGGVRFASTGYDPMLKKFLTSEKGPDITPHLGNKGPLHDGNRLEPGFLQQQESVDWWTENRNRWQGYRRYLLNVLFRGHIPEGGGWVGPKVLDMTGTGFRVPDTQRGYLRGAHHLVEDGKYEVTALCYRTLID